MTVRIIHGGLEEDALTKEIIIRGVLDQATLKFINMAWYQREQGFSRAHINEIIAGLVANGRSADITIGMRGQRCDTRGNTYLLHDKCFCIDGGQRLYAIAVATKENPGLKVSLGVKVYLGTTEEKENEMFCKLGTTQKRIAPNVLMRNQKKKIEAINVLVMLNQDEGFALYHRIAWDQVKRRSELMNGYTLCRVAGALHAHMGGPLRSSGVDTLACGLDRLGQTIGTDLLRTNVLRFFDAIDKCWNIRNLSGGHDEFRPHLKLEFMLTIAQLMSRYSEFWDGEPRHCFYCNDKFIKRMKGFKVADYMRTATKIPKEALFEVLRKRLNLAPIFEPTETEAAAE